jgi:hypothetical protein
MTCFVYAFHRLVNLSVRVCKTEKGSGCFSSFGNNLSSEGGKGGAAVVISILTGSTDATDGCGAAPEDVDFIIGEGTGKMDPYNEALGRWLVPARPLGEAARPA